MAKRKRPVTKQMKAGRILSHGKISSLTEEFRLKNDTPFALFIIPKVGSGFEEDKTVLVNCELGLDDTFEDCPFTLLCWDVPALTAISVAGIDTTKFDVFWGAGEGTEIQ